MVLSDQIIPYSMIYVWAAFEAKSPPTGQDLVTLIIITHCNSAVYRTGINTTIFVVTNHAKIEILIHI